jgi:hypothetical protein
LVVFEGLKFAPEVRISVKCWVVGPGALEFAEFGVGDWADLLRLDCLDGFGF